MQADVIDTLAGIAPGSHLDTVRRTRRPTAREHAQKSYDSLFAPADYGGFGPLERFAVAVFVAGLHGQSAIRAFYAEKLRSSAATDATRSAIDAEIAAASTKGPYGAFPKGPSARRTWPVRSIASPPRITRRSAPVSWRRSSMFTCWSSIRAMPPHHHCSRCSMPAGQRPRS